METSHTNRFAVLGPVAEASRDFCRTRNKSSYATQSLTLVLAFRQHSSTADIDFNLAG